jgi:hypothetical protein
LRKDPLEIIKLFFVTCGKAVLEKNFNDLASFCGFSLPVRKIFGISEPFKQIIKRPTQGTFLPKISFLGIIVSEKIFHEMLMRTRNVYAYKLP